MTTIDRYPTFPITQVAPPAPAGMHAHEFSNDGSGNVADCGSCGQAIAVPAEAVCIYCERSVFAASPVNLEDEDLGGNRPAQYNGSWSEQEDDPDHYVAFWHYNCAEDIPAAEAIRAADRRKPTTPAGQGLADGEQDGLTDLIATIEEQAAGIERQRIRAAILPALLREFPLADVPARLRIAKVVREHLGEEARGVPLVSALEHLEAAYDEGEPDACAEAVQGVLDAWTAQKGAPA